MASDTVHSYHQADPTLAADPRQAPGKGMNRDGAPSTRRSRLHRACCRAAVAALAAAAPLAWGNASLPAMNSYGQPPFVPVRADGTAGLARTFVQLLNKETGGQPDFQLDYLPRRRLELALGSRSFAGIALFLAPEFLAPAAQRGARWSEPVMVDENLIVSLRPLKLSSLQQLHGLRFGGIAGHIYRPLAPAIDNGRLHREDAADHISNLLKLCLGRVDFVVISRAELAGTRPHVQCPEPFRPAAFPEPQVILRRVLVRMPDGGSAQAVLDAVASVACGPQWLQTLAQYGLSTVGCRGAVARSADPPPPRGRKGRPPAGADDPRG